MSAREPAPRDSRRRTRPTPAGKRANLSRKLRTAIREKRFTYELLFELPDDRKRYEIFDGELLEMTSPTLLHQIVLMNLFLILANHVKRYRLGLVLLAPLDVILSSTNVYEPDLLYASHERLKEITGKIHIEGAPDLVVEVISGTGARDRVRKRRAYERFKIPHFWIIDPNERMLEELVLQGKRYKTSALVVENETFRPVIFPKLKIPLAKLWETR